MKKNPKKLRLSRETLALLESKAVAGGAAYVTSCTYPCDCPGGCTEEQPCMATIIDVAR